MPERVETGGLMSFDYSNSRARGLEEEQKREIEEGYLKAKERKARERRNRILIIVLIVLILAIFAFIIF
jgi:hypothetical protein